MTSLMQNPLSLLAQVEYSYSSQGQAPSPAVIIAELLIALFVIVAMWKVFTKAGRPGWAAIIPIYNMYVWCKIVGRPGWWNRYCFAGNQFSANSLLRQRSIPRPFGVIRCSRYSAATACLSLRAHKLNPSDKKPGRILERLTAAALWMIACDPSWQAGSLPAESGRAA